MRTPRLDSTRRRATRHLVHTASGCSTQRRVSSRAVGDKATLRTRTWCAVRVIHRTSPADGPPPPPFPFMTSWKLAADEHGILGVADTRAAGLTPKAVARLVSRGELTGLGRGWYAVGSPDTPEERHALLTRAALRAHEGRAVASHHSALCLLRLPTYRADFETIRLNRVTSGAPRTRRGQRLGRVVPAEAIAPPQAGSAAPTTVSPALAVVQAGISGGPMAGLVAGDAALSRDLVTRAGLDQALRWVHQHPGTRLLRPFLALADGRRASPGETRLGHAFHLMGLAVTPQFKVEAAGFVAFVDFRIDGTAVVVEFDGKVKYGRGRDLVDHFGTKLTPQQVLWREKQREDRIREQGYLVVRVTWAELDNPQALARRIGQAIRRVRASAPVDLTLRRAT